MLLPMLLLQCNTLEMRSSMTWLLRLGRWTPVLLTGQLSQLSCLISPCLTSSYLLSPHLTSSHLVSPHLTLSHLILPCFTSSISSLLVFDTVLFTQSFQCLQYFILLMLTQSILTCCCVCSSSQSASQSSTKVCLLSAVYFVDCKTKKQIETFQNFPGLVKSQKVPIAVRILGVMSSM